VGPGSPAPVDNGRGRAGWLRFDLLWRDVAARYCGIEKSNWANSAGGSNFPVSAKSSAKWPKYFFLSFSGRFRPLVLLLEYPGKMDSWCSGKQGGGKGRSDRPFCVLTCRGIPPWAPLSLQHDASRKRRGAHGGTPLQIRAIDPSLAAPYHPIVQPVIFTEQIREIDRLTVDNYHTPSLLLMEAAADSCLRAIQANLSDDLVGKKALVLCGKGNNGGDGAALARKLSSLGVQCDVILFGKLSETIGDARTNLDSVQKLAAFEAGSSASPAPLTFSECDGIASWEQLARPRKTYDVIVDALFGTGLTRPLEGAFLKIVDHLSLLKRARDRASGTRPLVLSVDIPSGLNADQSNPIGPAVQADITVTFTAPKPANVLPPACEFGGQLIVANIGSPASLIVAAKPWLFVTEEEDARRWLISSRYTPESYKNTHGHVLIAAGSRDYTGAAALCGNAAMRSGAGLVTVATPSSAQSAVATSLIPEVMTTALAETDRGVISDESTEHFLKLSAKATVVAIGPGLT